MNSSDRSGDSPQSANLNSASTQTSSAAPISSPEDLPCSSKTSGHQSTNSPHNTNERPAVSLNQPPCFPIPLPPLNSNKQGEKENEGNRTISTKAERSQFPSSSLFGSEGLSPVEAKSPKNDPPERERTPVTPSESIKKKEKTLHDDEDTESNCAQVLGDDDEEEWFEQDDFHVQAFPAFESIRRLGKLCDVTLVVGNERFSAHRLVLAATIPYFHSMFTCDMVEAQQPEINMQGIDPDTLEQLINFAYTAKLRITVLNVQNVMVGASFLQLSSIVEACCRFLQMRLQGSNVLNVRQFGMALGCNSLVRATDRFLQKHFTAVSKTEDFLNLSEKEITEIMSRDELFVTNEEQVFEAAMGWVRKDVEGRRRSMASLLSCVRLPLLKPQYITDRVASDALIRSCLKCRDLVDEAKDYHLMPERRPLLQTFRTKPRCCNDIPGIIYAVGGLTNSGDSLSTVEMYDPMVGRWSSIEPMTTLRSRVGVAVMDGLLYAIGGFNGHERLRTVEVFNPENRRWKEVAPLNNKRSALGAAVAGGDRLYVCGGYDGITSLSTVECYDPHSDRWIVLNCMTKQRSAAGISVLDGKIYVMGGHDGMSIFNSVECYDPETQRWTLVKPMLNRRCRLGAATLNGKLYACGGYDGAQFLKSVECYDPVKEEWKVIGNMNVKRSRVALVANCGKLYAIGGYDGISNLSSMEIFSPEENSWVFGASMMAHEGGVGIGVVPIIPKTDV